jgi:uncharacterized membrane protein YeaQ/YmgE (transglycosylase-associated protein family)
MAVYQWHTLYIAGFIVLKCNRKFIPTRNLHGPGLGYAHTLRRKDMGFISWLIVGGLAGWIASMIMGTNERQGCLANIVIGIVGAMIGGFVMNFFGGQGVTGLNITSILVAVIGAVILLWVVKAIRK